MTIDHEYVVLGGMNRALVGRYLSIAAAALSSFIVFAILTAVDIAKRLGLPIDVPPIILSLLSAGTIFGILYWIFRDLCGGGGPSASCSESLVS